MAEDRVLEDVATRVVGKVLLFRDSPTGGSYGNGLDQKRAARVASEGLDGRELYELLLAIAREATKQAAHEIEMYRSRVVHDLERLAKETDSLRLHRYVTEHARKEN